MSLIKNGITRLTMGDVTVAHVEVFTNAPDMAYLVYQDASGERFQLIYGRRLEDVVAALKTKMLKFRSTKANFVIIGRHVPGSQRAKNPAWPAGFPINPKA